MAFVSMLCKLTEIRFYKFSFLRRGGGYSRYGPMNSPRISGDHSPQWLCVVGGVQKGDKTLKRSICSENRNRSWHCTAE